MGLWCWIHIKSHPDTTLPFFPSQYQNSKFKFSKDFENPRMFLLCSLLCLLKVSKCASMLLSLSKLSQNCQKLHLIPEPPKHSATSCMFCLFSLLFPKHSYKSSMLSALSKPLQMFWFAPPLLKNKSGTHWKLCYSAFSTSPSHQDIPSPTRCLVFCPLP